MLGNRGDPSGQAASQRDEHELHRRRALILRGEDLRMVGLEAERRLVLLLAAEAEEAVDGRVAQGALLPGAVGAPLELPCLGGVGQGRAGGEQCLNIYAIVDLRRGYGHGLVFLSICGTSLSSRQHHWAAGRVSFWRGRKLSPAVL